MRVQSFILGKNFDLKSNTSLYPDFFCILRYYRSKNGNSSKNFLILRLCHVKSNVWWPLASRNDISPILPEKILNLSRKNWHVKHLSNAWLQPITFTKVRTDSLNSNRSDRRRLYGFAHLGIFQRSLNIHKYRYIAWYIGYKNAKWGCNLFLKNSLLFSKPVLSTCFGLQNDRYKKLRYFFFRINTECTKSYFVTSILNSNFYSDECFLGLSRLLKNRDHRSKFLLSQGSFPQTCFFTKLWS